MDIKFRYKIYFYNSVYISIKFIHFHFSFDNSQFSPDFCSRFDKLFRSSAMFPMRRRDPRSALRGLWTGAQAAVKSATGFAFN